jgi:4-diphosphocytidyl-2-C-methyl-D-erythritol kinase
MPIHAPAKLNLCLFLGPRREDGLHELCSLFEPLALADAIEVSEADRDEVLCAGVEGENLAARALAGLRERGWQGPPLRIEIEKRIPVAAGLGGGSADAAAVLRLAREPARGMAGSVPDLEELAAELGADVPSQLVPALALIRGAGERVTRLPDPEPHAVVLLPGGGGLPTAEVFAEADRLGLGRSHEELEALAKRLLTAAGAGASPLDYAELLENDLEPAARALRPDVGEALGALREAGAPLALLTGSGPTAFGLFADLAAARAAAERIDRDDAIVCEAGAP